MSDNIEMMHSNIYNKVIPDVVIENFYLLLVR